MAAPAAQPQAATELPTAAPPRGAMPILAFFFAATWFVQGAMAAHLPGLLQAAGASSTAAIAAAALVGPAQVGARHRRVRALALVPPDLLGPDRFGAASDRRRVHCLVRGSRHCRVRAVARCRQRHDHDRQGHLAVGVVRPARLRPAQRIAVGAGPRCCSRRRRSCSACCSTGSGSRRLGLSAGLCLAAFGSLFLLRPRERRRRPPLAGPRLICEIARRSLSSSR